MASEFETELLASTPALKKYVCANLYKKHHGHDVEDIVQETILSAWAAQESFDSSKAPMIRWLIAISRNVMRMSWREGWEKNKVEDGWEEVYENFPDTAQNAEQRIVMCDILGDIENLLPKRQSEALQAKVMGHCDQDIAKQMDTTVMAVKMCIHHGRLVIRQIHSESYEEVAA